MKSMKKSSIVSLFRTFVTFNFLKKTSSPFNDTVVKVNKIPRQEISYKSMKDHGTGILNFLATHAGSRMKSTECQFARMCFYTVLTNFCECLSLLNYV